jgi:mannose-6-phosphate isomerase-like protein (cupin superfamily)
MSCEIALDVLASARFRKEKLTKANLFSSARMFCDVYGLEPGQEQPVHDHAENDKVYYVLEGTGVFTVGVEELEAGPGQLIVAPAGEPHGVRNASAQRLTLLVVMAPNPTP